MFFPFILPSYVRSSKYIVIYASLYSLEGFEEGSKVP